MAKSSKKPIKLGVVVGGGLPPGYQWNVSILDRAYVEAMDLLDRNQYDHIADQVRELARQPDPTHSLTVDVRPIEDFHEIRDKGGVLGQLNIRVFYLVDSVRRTIVILGVIKKENNGPTPNGDKFRTHNRIQAYFDHVQPLA